MTEQPTGLRRLSAPFRRAPGPGGLEDTVSAARAVELAGEGATVLDVRERSEWRTGHVPAAVHVPLGDLDAAPRRLPGNRPVLVVCASGMRSRTAAKHLRGLGFDAVSVSGGMAAWRSAGGTVRR